MSQKKGAKGIRWTDLEEERELDQEMLEHEANLPSYMDVPNSSEVYYL